MVFFLKLIPHSVTRTKLTMNSVISQISAVLVAVTTMSAKAETLVGFDGILHRDGLGSYDQVTYSSARITDSDQQWILKEPGMLKNPGVQLSPSSKLVAVLSQGVLNIYRNDSSLIRNLGSKTPAHTFELLTWNGANLWKGTSPQFRWLSDHEFVIVMPETGGSFQCNLVVGIKAGKALVSNLGTLDAILKRDGAEIPIGVVDDNLLALIMLSRISRFDHEGWRTFFWSGSSKSYLDMWSSKAAQEIKAKSLDQLANEVGAQFPRKKAGKNDATKADGTGKR